MVKRQQLSGCTWQKCHELRSGSGLWTMFSEVSIICRAAWAFCLDDSDTLQNISCGHLDRWQEVRSDILPVLHSPWPAARQEIRQTRLNKHPRATSKVCLKTTAAKLWFSLAFMNSNDTNPLLGTQPASARRHRTCVQSSLCIRALLRHNMVSDVLAPPDTVDSKQKQQKPQNLG